MIETQWIKSDAICIDKRGKEYRILTTARDIQTGDRLVIYIQNFGDKETLSCPLDAFSVSFSFKETKDLANTEIKQEKNSPESAEDRMMLFFETNDFDEKVKLLRELYTLGQLTDNILDNLAATLDVVIDSGDLSTRYNQLRVCVETRARYESGRLRIKG